MAPGSARRRRRSETQDEEDDDDHYGNPSQSQDSPKRPRLDLNSEDEDDAFGGSNGLNGVADVDGFHPGAIVRVSVVNFVTYEKAEFFPGPNLNMVIGPNGTGKSSLVCAICLGLGYSPRHLGRAGSVKEFVKHGKDTATIEIELQKRPNDRSNYIIRVQIRREQNSQKWWLNGKEATHKSIQNLMRTLKIQVDNLCQFLPQDRVVEFAACTPIDLLNETLRAAAPEEMIEWQTELRGLHKEKKELAEATRNDSETLQNLENRQQGLQADVDRIHEREEIIQKVENLKLALVLVKYDETRRQWDEAKRRRKEAERAVKLLEEENGPSLQAVNDKQTYSRQIEMALSGRQQVLKNSEAAAKELSEAIASASDGIKQLENKLAAERTGFEDKKKELSACRSKITSYQADLKNRPADFNAPDWNQRIRAEEHTLRETETEKRQLSAGIDSVKQKGMAVKQNLKQAREEIESLDTQQGQQLNLMKRSFPEIAAGWEWIQDHQQEFEKEVFGPPIISCSIKDERYSDQIQSFLQNDDFQCFTAQTTNDYKKLSDQLYRVMSLSVVIRTCAHSLDNFKPAADAKSLGLDGFAIDYLEGPSPVLAMFCAERRLHMSGVSLNDHNDAEYERLINHGQVNTWAAGKQSYTVRRRKEYGPNAMTTITKGIQPGKYWTSQPVDSQEKEELGRRVDELTNEREALTAEYKDLDRRRQSLDQRRDELVEKIDQLKQEKSALQREFQKWQSIPEKIESEEKKKTRLEQELKTARLSMVEINLEWDKSTVDRAKIILQHSQAVDQIRQARQSVLEAKLRLIEARSDVLGLQRRNADVTLRLAQERQNYEEASEKVRQAREDGKKQAEAVKDVTDQHNDKLDLLNQLIEGRTSVDMEADIDAEEAGLELVHAVNPNVIREFEKRGQEIARLRQRAEGAAQQLADIVSKLEELMSKFEPQLDALVSKINDAFAYNFEQISCAGEVRVHKDEDFDLWALDIMVKFRENETLQQLTAHRQSGGERAVSTIFYLMALQSMAQSPFRVVDEINQGMDPRNERMVHERMVEIACREHTSQYFLITPKLLTGLRYDPKMRVLCIASGEHMPREGSKMDFRRCLEIQRSLMASA